MPNEDQSPDISPEGSHQSRIFSSPESVSSSSTISPHPTSPPAVEPEHNLLDNRRLAAAKETVGFFYRWAREDIILQLNGAIQVRNSATGSMELEVVTKKVWVRESLRSRYNVYIQMYSDYVEDRQLRAARGVVVAKNAPGKECEFPGCGREFIYGDYRVAFEPPGWSIPVKPKSPIMDLDTSDSDSEDARPLIPDEIEDPIILLPDYNKLLTRGSIDNHDRGEFYCPRCFEMLLDFNDTETLPMGRPAKRKRAAGRWIHPSPLCRIYSSVHAETRSSAEGRYELDYAAYEVVRRWKDALFDEGMREIKAKFGGVVFKSEDTDEGAVVEGGEEADEDGEDDDDGVGDEEQVKVQVGGGRGLAECLAVLKGEQPKLPKGRKKARH